MTKTHLGRSYRILVKKLSIKLTPTSPLDFVSRLVNKLFLSTETELIATEIIKQAIDKEITSGRDPNNVAVAALYIALSVTSDKKNSRGYYKNNRCYRNNY
ncbi:MAG: hypothetical protein LBV42_04035 [Methanobrevibacter sp.]|nr:hypothetical protein [Methanobrevibacter sp.]